MWKAVKLLTFWFMMFYPDVVLCSNKDFYHLFNGTFCTAFDVIEKIIASETLCAIQCSKNKDILGCRGFCYHQSSKTCKLYGVPDLGADSIRLNWIAFKKMGVSLNYDNALTECSNNGYGVPLPTTDEERFGMLKIAKEDFRLDLNDLEVFKTFKTSEGKIPDTFMWTGDQPNHLGGQRCVAVEFIIGATWYDWDCTSNFPVYCQKPRPLQCKEGVEIGAVPDRPDTEICYMIRM